MIPPRVALIAAVCALAGPLRADWSPTLAATAEWNSNVTNANRSADVISALQLRADLGLFSYRVALGHDDSLVLGATVDAETWPRFDGLDRCSLGPRLAWRHKFGLGALAPVLSLELDAEAVAARDADRGGAAGAVRLAWRQRFGETAAFSLGYELSRHDAREGVYDRTGGELATEVAWDLDEAWRLGVGASWRDGDVLAYATPPRPDLLALARDRSDVDTFDRPMMAYAIKAHTLGSSIALTRSLDEQTAVILRYGARTTSRGPLTYVNHLVSVAYTRQF